MEAHFWIRISAQKRGIVWRMSKTQTFVKKPPTEANEVAIKAVINIPDSVFEKPQFEFHCDVPEGERQAVLTAEMADDIAKALSEQVGITVRLSAPGGE